ncbi:MAG: ComEC/Rec2 family competence protein [Patescibacteria group bacterium]
MFVGALLGFVVGIGLGEITPAGFAGATALMAMGAFLAWIPVMWRVRIICVGFCIGCAFGIMRTSLVSPSADVTLDSFVSERIVITGRVVDEPDKRDQATLITVLPTIVRVGDQELNVESGVRVLAKLPRDSEVFYADTVTVRGRLALPKAFETDGGRFFDYPGYLQTRGIGYVLEWAQLVEVNDGGFTARGFLFSAKRWYVEGLGAALPEPYASLAGGITVGDKRSVGEDLSEVFRATGLSHIIVLSGYNITVVVTALLSALASLSIRNRSVVGVLVILAFIMMTGASASGVRAGIMASVVLLAGILHRRYAASRALLCATTVMLVWNPLLLLHDPGFQLSIVATVGVIWGTPLAEKLLRWTTVRWGMREILASTIAAQVVVLPLLLYQNGLFSVLSFPANALVLPFVPVAMAASFVAGIVAAVSAPLGIIVGLPAYLLLLYMVHIAETLASFSFATVTFPSFSIAVLFCVYSVMAGAFLWHEKNRTEC